MIAKKNTRNGGELTKTYKQHDIFECELCKKTGEEEEEGLCETQKRDGNRIE